MRNMLWCVITLLMLASCGSKKEDSRSNPDADSATEMIADTVIETGQDSAARSLAQAEKAEESSKTATAGKVTIPDNNRPTLLDFTATWCGPCRMMKPIFEELEDTYDDMMNFVSVDIDINPDLAEQYRIQVVPTFIFLDSRGSVIKRVEGVVEQEVLENEIGKMITK